MKTALAIACFIFVAIGFYGNQVAAAAIVSLRFKEIMMPPSAVSKVTTAETFNFSLLVVGGQEAIPHTAPYQVSLQVQNGPSWYHVCGGTIISPDIILTTARCVLGWIPNFYRVVAGEHNLQIAEATEQVRDIKSIKIHPQYDGTTYDYDIAVIKLSNPLEFNSEVQQISLAVNEPTSGICNATGWGNTHPSRPQLPSKLQQIALPLVSRSNCSRIYQGYNYVTSRMICAGGEGIGICNGDNGGPLVCSDGKLAGITSWLRTPCGGGNYPGVFTNIALLRTWIDSQ